jgi:hypothetical protein
MTAHRGDGGIAGAGTPLGQGVYGIAPAETCAGAAGVIDASGRAVRELDPGNLGGERFRLEPAGLARAHDERPDFSRPLGIARPPRVPCAFAASRRFGIPCARRPSRGLRARTRQH